MKKVLVTGENGYIGKQFKKWIDDNESKIILEFVSIREESWKVKNFSDYDAVLHLAGIAHVSRNPKLEDLYYKINRDLTLEVAKKAKKDGVKQFIFMSSIIVYGKKSVGLENGIINKNTLPIPNDFYGDSKLQAEKLLEKLQNNDFNVAIIRPPMIYGPESKGNFELLKKAVPLTFLFPYIENKRSMLFIDNLSNFLKLIILNEDKGMFFPQNKEYVSTSNLVKEIANTYKRKMILTTAFNFLILRLSQRVNVIEKLFGNLAYDHSLSTYRDNYQLVEFKKTIKDSILRRSRF
ncbi:MULTISPECIES: NAD-dependent epimerase/dehydratase family protein [Exiguobacterium]|uniref:NAD-dependent epimerase/dehydratase family protein n=1 Tax=Exiguobacterium TaxID=33986 RepID=UPI0004943CBA|nr:MULTISPECIES: NAD-dependent epimerase/dehydratase family protein [Exiguobacterium]HCD60551.1 NAD-dependent epimerase [Exiguobacterium sp.]